MYKAKFIHSYQGYGYDRNTTYLEYEYRGKTYTVVTKLGGNEPLKWQHASEQARIDRLLDEPEREGNMTSNPDDAIAEFLRQCEK